MLAPGDKFDRYTIEGVIGEGGMGRVYKAHDTRLHRSVALKLLRLDQAADPNDSTNAASRMMREARAAAALDHPNAVSVFDVAEVDGALYIAMEFISGRTLRTYVGDNSVPREIKLRWLIDTARALAAAHERGLVHRDIKPENVMVRDDGVVKVLDFGIAKRVAIDMPPTGMSDTAMMTQTADGTILGTPRYLSPEQVRGEAVDGRADQFAWGVVAYELLTGELPWKGETTGLNLLLAILSTSPDPPSKLAPDLPSLVDATIMKTLSKAPADRFASMEYVVAALESFITASRRSIATIEVMETRRTEPAPPLSPANTPPPAGDRAGWKLAAIGAAVLAVVAGAGVVIDRTLVRGRTPLAAHDEAGTPASAAASATGLAELAPPKTSNPEARAAFEAALIAFRDGVFETSRQSLERAVRLDPAFGAAYLRLAYMDSLVSSDESEVRKDFKNAMQYRSTLSTRDEALLDAFEPYLQREPSDLKESEKRLVAATARYPNDAELAYFLGSVRFDGGDLARAVPVFERAIEIDPKFAQAWAAKGGCQAYLGQLDDARASLARCLAVSGSATECMWYRAQIDEQEGDCEAEEAMARRWIGKDPDDYFAYQWLAKSLHAQHKPVETVRTALEQKWARVSSSRRPRLELIDRIRLDLASGDFARAEARTLELEQLLAGEPGALAHAEPHSLLVQIYMETGRTADARKVADAFLKRKDAWVTPHRVDDRAIWEDAIPLMLTTMLHTGGITAADFESKRAEWLRAWEAKTTGVYVSYLWIYGFALPVGSGREAEVAMSALPKYAPLPPFTPTSIAPAYIGNAYLEAGRVDEAVAPLTKATRSCIALYEPVAHTRAMLHLGAALAVKQKKDEACAAYAAVVVRWGGAKPKSITLTEAKKRAAALGCTK